MSSDFELMDRLVIDSVLTTIYRSIPLEQPGNGPQKFSGKCLASARAALTTINRSWDTVGKLDSKKWASFLRWTVNFSPFTPFVVLLSNILCERNEADLELRVRKAVETMKAPAENSIAIKKLCNTCVKFIGIAQAYMSRKRTQSSGDGVIPNDGGERSQMDLVDPNAGLFDFLPSTAVFHETLDLPLYQQDWDTVIGEWSALHQD